MNMNCTAGLKVKTSSEGKVHVEACHTHHGHAMELQHIWLSKQGRQEIATKIQQGVSADKILDDIRQSMPDTLHRHHILDKKDISNIQQAYGLKNLQRHANDQQSVLAWIQEWKSSPDTNPILYYKMQGEEDENLPLQKEDFMVIVQSTIQRNMLQKFGAKGVCIDSTHGTTGYDFYLTTLMVIDEFGSGFPVAWCLSNHEDTTFMSVFFEAIKRNSGQVTANWFMSDLANQYYNAWVGVMKHHPTKLLCTWHVDKAWRENIREKIKDVAVQTEVYKMLRTVLEETSEATFDDVLTKMLTQLQSDDKTTAFQRYFSSEWVPKAHEWAFCYRCGLGINTNMYVEAFHRTFKHNYLKGKFNKRVDTCLLNLLKFIRDKTYERTIKLPKGKLTTRIREIQIRHAAASRMKVEDVKSKGRGEWEVKSEDGKRDYNVQQVNEVCPESNCSLKCHSCNNTCPHTFSCTCIDSLMHGTVCKHVHQVSMLLAESDHTKFESSFNPSPVNNMPDNANEVEMLVKEMNQNTTQSSVAALQVKVKSKLLQLITNVENCTNKEALQELDKGLSAKIFRFESMLQQPTPATIALKENGPANKNLERQRRFFFSTKKKRKRQENIRYSKPTQEEKENMFQNKGECIVHKIIFNYFTFFPYLC